MKKPLLIVLFILGAVLIFRFLTPEDTWICQNGLWVRHGNPRFPQPTGLCQSKEGITLSQGDNKIRKFSSLEDLRSFLEENQELNIGYGWGGGIMYEKSMSNDLPMSVAVGRSEEASPAHSETNVQVQGVDEGDIVKTDGNYIYAVSGKNLFLIDARQKENPQILSKIEFKSTPQEIYVNGNYLVVYGNNDFIYDQSWFRNFKRQSPYTFFKVFDVSDRKNPNQVRDLDFEGSIVATRMIGNYVYLITNYYNSSLYDTVVYPRIIHNGELVNKGAPDIYYFDLPYDSFNFTVVSVINVKNPAVQIKQEVYLMPGGTQNVFISQDNIYLTYTEWISEEELAAQVLADLVYPRLSQTDKTKIKEITNAKNYVLTRSEKLQKITQLMQSFVAVLPESEQNKLQDETEAELKKRYKDLSKELEKTIIHKVAIDKEKLKYQTFGEVTGSVLNQFSMDESTSGDFRIATTKNRSWGRFENSLSNNKSYNNLYILDENMKVVGRLEDLALDERIYSVRFMQNRAYLVTFKQTDPLFVIDLQNPASPKVLGKLKVPGFSQYLHPYDENTLIGFGHQTSETESGTTLTEGLKISLFDVSDVNNLKEIDKVTLGERGASSIALYDHKAFMFDKEKNLLVVPVEIKKNEEISRYRYFRGAVVFSVTSVGFTKKGEIDHYDGTSNHGYDWWGYSGWDTTVKRSLWIDNVLYTMSDKYLKANKVSDLTELKNLKLQFPVEKDSDFKIIN